MWWAAHCCKGVLNIFRKQLGSAKRRKLFENFALSVDVNNSLFIALCYHHVSCQMSWTPKCPKDGTREVCREIMSWHQYPKEDVKIQGFDPWCCGESGVAAFFLNKYMSQDLEWAFRRIYSDIYIYIFIYTIFILEYLNQWHTWSH